MRLLSGKAMILPDTAKLANTHHQNPEANPEIRGISSLSMTPVLWQRIEHPPIEQSIDPESEISPQATFRAHDAD